MPLSLQQPPAEDLGILRGVKGDSRPPPPSLPGAAGGQLVLMCSGGGVGEDCGGGGGSRGGRSWELARRSRREPREAAAQGRGARALAACAPA